MGHRRRAQCHCQGRSSHARGEDLEAAERPRQRQSQYAGFRRPRPHLVHRAVRHLWPARSAERRDAGSFLGKPDLETGEPTVIEPQTPKAGTRRVWSDSKGRLWVSEWNAGNLSIYDPASQSWEVYKLPGDSPHAYAVYVDGKDKVWVSDFGANAILKFDPDSKSFASFPSDKPDAAVRQLNGRP